MAKEQEQEEAPKNVGGPDHFLYCPVCDQTVVIPYATEISSRHCTNKECLAPADKLWPSKTMYERDAELKEKASKVAQEAPKVAQQEQAEIDDQKSLVESFIDRLKEGI